MTSEAPARVRPCFCAVEGAANSLAAAAPEEEGQEEEEAEEEEEEAREEEEEEGELVLRDEGWGPCFIVLYTLEIACH